MYCVYIVHKIQACWQLIMKSPHCSKMKHKAGEKEFLVWRRCTCSRGRWEIIFLVAARFSSWTLSISILLYIMQEYCKNLQYSDLVHAIQPPTYLLSAYQNIPSGINFQDQFLNSNFQMTEYLKKLALTCSYNQLSGLLFDKMLRSLVTFLSGFTQWSVSQLANYLISDALPPFKYIAVLINIGENLVRLGRT